MIATVVDWAALRDVVIASLAAGIGVTIVVSLSIRGLTLFADRRRDDRLAVAWAYAGLAAVGIAASLLAVAYGIYLMASK